MGLQVMQKTGCGSVMLIYQWCGFVFVIVVYLPFQFSQLVVPRVEYIVLVEIYQVECNCACAAKNKRKLVEYECHLVLGVQEIATCKNAYVVSNVPQ